MSETTFPPVGCNDPNKAKVLWEYLTKGIGLETCDDRVHYHLHLGKCSACSGLLKQRSHDRFEEFKRLEAAEALAEGKSS